MHDDQRLAAIARRDVSVLITGQSGTGKEVLARQIHAMSPRACKNSGGPFMAVDCTALRDTLFESQMFGHERGAFTGADRATLGFARCAGGGTLMLDEIGELNGANQARLLRLIQERTVTPLGSTKSVPVNVRFIAATHRDLWAMAARGEFRSDLLYRLDVVRVHLPPLCERSDELPGFVETLIEELAHAYDEDPSMVHVSASAMELLASHHWPGNIRELRNAIEHAYVFAEPDADGRVRIEPEHLPERLVEWDQRQASGSVSSSVDADTLGKEAHIEIRPLEIMERLWMQRAIEQTGGNKTRAAKLLGISRNRLLRATAS